MQVVSFSALAWHDVTIIQFNKWNHRKHLHNSTSPMIIISRYNKRTVAYYYAISVCYSRKWKVHVHGNHLLVDQIFDLECTKRVPLIGSSLIAPQHPDRSARPRRRRWQTWIWWATAQQLPRLFLLGPAMIRIMQTASRSCILSTMASTSSLDLHSQAASFVEGSPSLFAICSPLVYALMHPGWRSFSWLIKQCRTALGKVRNSEWKPVPPSLLVDEDTYIPSGCLDKLCPASGDSCPFVFAFY